MGSIFDGNLPWNDKEDMKKSEFSLLAKKAQDEKVTETWHSNGSLTLTSEDGETWFPADVAKAYYGTKGKYKGKGGGICPE